MGDQTSAGGKKTEERGRGDIWFATQRVQGAAATRGRARVAECLDSGWQLNQAVPTRAWNEASFWEKRHLEQIWQDLSAGAVIGAGTLWFRDCQIQKVARRQFPRKEVRHRALAGAEAEVAGGIPVKDWSNSFGTRKKIWVGKTFDHRAKQPRTVGAWTGGGAKVWIATTVYERWLWTLVESCGGLS